MFEPLEMDVIMNQISHDLHNSFFFLGHNTYINTILQTIFFFGMLLDIIHLYI